MVLSFLFLVSSCTETSTVNNGKDAVDAASETVRNKEDTIIIGPGHDLDVQGIPTDEFDFGGDEPEDVGDVDVPEEELPEVAEPPPDVPEELPDVVEPPDTPDAPDVEDVQPDVPDTKPDNSCTPVCAGKECGSDGCDGVCGYCAYGQVCDPDGKCVADICPTQCTVEVEGEIVPLECGPDNCGGFCGYCVVEGTVCGEDGFCYAGECDADCKNKDCGPDGCGGSCGFCQFGELCSEDFDCIPHPCGDVTYKGKCEDKYNLVECIGLELVYTNCLTMPDKMCGWNENVGQYECIQETGCEPQCTFADGTAKECGTDGCWGNCGMCPKGWGCAAGLCSPAEGGECAWIDGLTGVCVGDVKWFCSVGLLYGYDCMEKEEKTCGWDPKANFGLGGYECVELE